MSKTSFKTTAIGLILTYSTLSIAQGTLEPTRLKKGVIFTPPENGWFFTDEAELANRIQLVKYNYCEELTVVNEKINTNLKTELKYQAEISDTYKREYKKVEKELTLSLKRESRNKLLYMIAGSALTIAAGFALGYVARGVK